LWYFLRKSFKIIAYGDTVIVHYPLSIFHWLRRLAVKLKFDYRSAEPGGTQWCIDQPPGCQARACQRALPAEPSGLGNLRIATHRARIVSGDSPSN